MSNQQDNQPQQELNEGLIRVENQLRDAIAAEGFFNQASGKLFQQYATQLIDKIVKDITSDKYLKDHTGYVNALADLNAYRKMLRMMQLTGSPQHIKRLKNTLEEESA